jgi:hypothetical protein
MQLRECIRVTGLQFSAMKIAKIAFPELRVLPTVPRMLATLIKLNSKAWSICLNEIRDIHGG